MVIQLPYKRLLYSLAILTRETGEILLLFRSPAISMGNSYGLPGGQIEKHESMRDAVVREVYEELGIVVEPQDATLVHVMHFKGTSKELDEECTAFFFKIDTWSQEAYNKEPNKHTHMEWFLPTALPENMLERHKQAITLGMQGITYSEHNWPENTKEITKKK